MRAETANYDLAQLAPSQRIQKQAIVGGEAKKQTKRVKNNEGRQLDNEQTFL